MSSILFGKGDRLLSNNTLQHKALEEKENKLDEIIRDCQGALVSFSGGADSAFLLYKATQVLGKENVLAVTAVSPIRPSSEKQAACELAAQLKVPHRLIHTSELSCDPFVNNSSKRCYHCKKELFATLAAISLEMSLPCIMDGGNLDDLDEYRPGATAAQEFGVRSPLQEASLTKEEIRFLSRRYSLPTWNRPANSCLATRFPYGEKLEPEKLARVEKAEEFLYSLGLKKRVRVRSHEGSASIEVEAAEAPLIFQNKAAIITKFKKIGFTRIVFPGEEDEARD